MITREMIDIKDRHTARLMQLPNVLGVAVGFKYVKGVRTDRTAIVVMVEKKIAPSRLAPQYLVPKDLNGVETDVIETGKIVALADPTKRHRPAPPGVSVGHGDITAGTLGLWVIDSKTGNLAMLSNNHVLANSNNAGLGDSIFQPGPADGGTPADNDMAWLSRVLPLEFTSAPCPIASAICRTLNALLAGLGRKTRIQLQSAQSIPNVADCALAIPRREEDVLLEILQIGKPGTIIRKPEIGLKVQKYGRTTQRTEGIVIVIDASVQVNYGGPIALFEHQIVSDIPSAGGDSGSSILDMDRWPVGLLFAGSESENITIINEMQRVKDALPFEFVE